MDLGIAGRWALVCGASKGLGYGCASALLQNGVNVVINARNDAVLQDAASALRKDAENQARQSGGQAGKVIAVARDITTEPGRQAALEAPGGPGPDFDIVVTNAGGPPPGQYQDWDRDDWIKAIDANMLTPIALIKATVDGMQARGFGRIVNITSTAVKAPISTLGLSNGARSGLTGFIAGLARSEIAARGVTINNILPGRFDTDRLKSTMRVAAQASGQSIEALREEQQLGIPAGRFGRPDEFGALCAFLCSVHAGYITGQNMLIDGGAYPGTY
ncbi:oxidoreductase, short chain dehydrogenase/reductase family protein [Bordetella bronchiseptica MBORD675]|uniref:SDR family oxidoreductase n=1 Tax=Bordetella bronchiseptica TaxID=518 RepID=UPI00028FE143|nr:SDR family oxidoreductase [Bordetella bronchiseptica]KDC92576.1 oxidoreductase, short chain dehydrogenase/reductase family protein [Bordetella bronchiseptica MBORD675]QIX99782.1 SDR family oxidoreductase [Bordetella bronchiseptica]CCN06091.1 probable short-chain dehydrogenase [Bordetella bronchiseptica Bbr77]